MNIMIRPYIESDFEEIVSWWQGHGEIAPTRGCMVENGTFVVVVDDVSIMTLTVFMTQSLEIAYFEGYCSRPGVDKLVTNQCGVILWNFCYQYLKSKGYKRVICYTDKDKLVERYDKLGMTHVMSNLHSLVRVL